jgi:hypothetical protein
VLKAAGLVILAVVALTAVVALNGRSRTSAAAPSRAPASAPSRFAAANSACGNTWDLRDGGKTLIGDGKGKEDASGLSIQQMVCPLELLQAPTAVVSHMDSTRALDGQQTDEWDGIKARWTFHPDNGFAVTLVDSK